MQESLKPAYPRDTDCMMTAYRHRDATPQSAQAESRPWWSVLKRLIEASCRDEINVR